jgi:catechol 2,3-dioxygenase-like lactoylglutathione lyase family enzyme
VRMARRFARLGEAASFRLRAAPSPALKGCAKMSKRVHEPNRPLFRKLDNLLLRVADLDAAIAFYRDQLGHRLLWRSAEAVGFALPDTDAELVVHLHIGPETDVLVDDVDDAFNLFLNAGGEAVEAPFEIAIGRCARVRDPFGNVLVILDQSKGRLVTDADGRVTGVRPHSPD